MFFASLCWWLSDETWALSEGEFDCCIRRCRGRLCRPRNIVAQLFRPQYIADRFHPQKQKQKVPDASVWYSDRIEFVTRSGKPLGGTQMLGLLLIDICSEKSQVVQTVWLRIKKSLSRFFVPVFSNFKQQYCFNFIF